MSISTYVTKSCVRVSLFLLLLFFFSPVSRSDAAEDPNKVLERLQSIETQMKQLTAPHPWWNLGVGFGVAVDATDGDDNDSSGILLHLKGYPTRLGWESGDTLASKEDGKKWWCNPDRFSLVAGMSVGEFTGGGVEGPVWVVGAGYDITDELALVGGVSWFEFEEEGGRRDTDAAFYFAVAMDVKIFNILFGK
jgi:hypothetical protein